MNNTYLIVMRAKNLQYSFDITGCESAFRSYLATKEWVEALGFAITVDLIDIETAEVIASNYDFG